MKNETGGEKNLTKLIREIVRSELKLAGGTKLITSDTDIDIVTKGTHIARYNGFEIVTGGGGMISDVLITRKIKAPTGSDLSIEVDSTKSIIFRAV